jgi:hypothetical protein
MLAGNTAIRRSIKPFAAKTLYFLKRSITPKRTSKKPLK